MSDEKKKNFYLSVDVESDGMCPGVNSMLSLGAVMLDENFAECGWFSENLSPLPSPARQNPETMKWWSKHQEAYTKATEDPSLPGVVMHNFLHWLDHYEGRIIFIGYPVTFDFNFVWYYLWYFTGGAPPFSHGGLDIKTLAAVALNVTYEKARKADWPERWSNPELKHTHVAVEDARDQAYSFVQITKELQERNNPLLVGEFKDVTDEMLQLKGQSL